MHNQFEFITLHLTESTIWCLLFIGFAKLIREQSSKVRCVIYQIALLKFLVPTPWLAQWFHVQPAEELAPYVIALSEPLLEFTQSPPTTQNTPILLIVWIIGITFLTIKTSLSLIRFKHEINKTSIPLDDRYAHLLKTALKRQGYHSQFILGYFTETGISLGLYGIFRPRIIAKREFLEILTDEEILAAFQHEIAHWKRRDNLWALLYGSITSILWFHPLVWYLHRKIMIETEKSCDEDAISTGLPASHYAQCLLKAAQYSSERRYLYTVAMSETSIKTRVQNIIQYQKGNIHIMKTITIIIAALGLVFGSLTIIASAQDTQDGVYTMEEVDKKPKAIQRTPPVYPESLKAEKIGGKVIVSFIVDTEGIVRNAEAKPAEGTDPAFVAPTLDAITQWTFEPGEVNGKPVNVRTRLPMVFDLSKSKLLPKNIGLLKKSDHPKSKEFMIAIEKKLKTLKKLPEAKRKIAIAELEEKIKVHLANIPSLANKS